jgi:uncharacterized membrane protein
MELLKTAVDYMVYGVSVAGLLVILWGLLLVSKDFLLGLFNEEPQTKRQMRQKLGSYLVLSLEFFIAADIIRTIIRPSWNEIGMLAAIIALRTVLSYFLGLELREKA